MKKTITYYCDPELMDDQTIKDCYINVRSYNPDATDEECDEEIRTSNEYDWEDLLDTAEKIDHVKVQANLGLWYGRREGYAEFNNLKLAIQHCLINGMQYVKVYESNGQLSMEVHHHDGTNYYDFKKKSDKINRWCKLSLRKECR